MLILPRRGIWAEQRGDNSDRGMQQWNGLETLLLKAGIDKEGMTEWNKSKKPYRNNGPLSRTNLNATQTVHSTTLSVYISTHPGVRIPPSVWHDFWLLSPPLKTASLDWKSVLLGRASARQKGVEERGVGFSDAAGASPSSSLSPRRITPSLSYCSQYSPSSQNSTVPPLCCPQAKVCGSFVHHIRKSLLGRMLPIQPAD